MSITWIPLSRNYTDEFAKLRARRQTGVKFHPLDTNEIPLLRNLSVTTFPNKSIVTKKKNINFEFNPLSDDPLNTHVAKEKVETGLDISTKFHNNNYQSQDETKMSFVEKWNKRKNEIKRDYSIAGNITIGSRAFAEVSGSGIDDDDGSSSSNKHVDVYQKRLANLERREKEKEDKVVLSHTEYAAHIERLQRDLEKAWKSDERVQALKYAIQLSKLLSDTTIPKFYPTAFVQISEALDKFGELVYARILSIADDAIYELHYKSQGPRLRLPANFKHTEIPEVAQETCKNWIYKILCIRELLPRIYIEMSLLRCYQFIFDSSEYFSIVDRLGETLRGIGNHLVSAYARAYLIVCSSKMFPTSIYTSSLTSTLVDEDALAFAQLQECYFSLSYDVLYLVKSFSMTSHARLLEKCGLQAGDYLRLLMPAIDWIVTNAANRIGTTAQIVGHSNVNIEKKYFQKLIFLHRDQCNSSSIILHTILKTFPLSVYFENILAIISLIQAVTVDTCECNAITEVHLCDLLAQKLHKHPQTLSNEVGIQLLNEVWRCLSKSEDLDAFIHATISWLKLLLEQFSEKETTLLLREMLSRYQEHVKKGRVLMDTTVDELDDFVTVLVSNVLKSGSGNAAGPDGGRAISSSLKYSILSSDIMSPLLEMFPSSRRVALCKRILSHVATMPLTGDLILLHSMLDVAHTLHDSIDILSPRDDVKEAVQLINSFISKIDCGKDFEQQLSLYVECRAMFPRMKAVLETLIFAVGSLAMRTCEIMHKTGHTKRTAAFVRACLAYCHITIPSIGDVFCRLRLLILCAQIAVRNQSLPQTDTFLKAAISAITEAPEFEVLEERARVPTEEKVALCTRQLLSLLVVVPGHPDIGPFYLIRGLLSALPRYAWQATTGVRIRLYMDIVVLLCTLAQSRLPYRMPLVEANDELYGGVPSYQQELRSLVMTVLDDIVGQMTTINQAITAQLAAASKLGETGSATGRSKTSTTALQSVLARCALDLCAVLAVHMHLNEDVCITFVSGLLTLACKHVHSCDDKKYMKTTAKFIHKKILCFPSSSAACSPSLSASLTACMG